jgi:Phage tail lysozyme
MAFNVGISSKDTFNQLKKLTPRQRVDYVKKSGDSGANILSMLTPVEFAELFPNYFRKGLPDVAGFREAISRRSTQKQDDINFGLSQGAKSIQEAEQMGTWRRRGGGGDGPGQVTSSIGGDRSVSNKVMARDIYNYLKSKGVDHVHAMGILANIQGESAFRPGIMPSEATMRREGGPSGGLFQHHDNPSRGEYRFSNMVKAAGGEGVWQKNWKGQIDYALTEPDMKKYLGRKFDDEKAAVKGFIVDFERPRNPDSDYANRVSYLSSISSAVSSTDTGPQASMGDVSRYSTKSAGYFGESNQCVALSKHFSNVGAAKEWNVKPGNISAGTVIATMSYNDRSGGKMAKDMPDKQSHYHTGIALNSPNSNGDVLILEQFVGQPARVRMININNYNGERWGVVEGGEPSDKSMQAVALAKGIANPDQLALMEGTATGAPTKQAGLEVKPVQEAPTPLARPTSTSTEQQQQYPADQQQQQDPANKQTAKVEKTDKSKKSVDSYKFDPDKYYNEVNTKHPEAKFFGYDRDRIMKETYQGFEEAQAAGAIKWNKKTNEIQILDPNHEKVKSIYNDMESQNIDRNAFLTKTEAGGSGTAKVSKRNRHQARDNYAPDVSPSGLNRGTKLIDYKGSLALNEIGLSQEHLNAIREAKASIESSGGNYGLRGGSSKRFSGAYQMGGNEIKMAAKVLGEQAPITRVKGRKTPVASDAFLNDPMMQERYHEAFLVAQHRQLMKNKTYAAMGPEKRAEILGFAHNAGAGGASRFLKTGQSRPDAFGTQPQKYAAHVRTQLSGMQVAKNMEAEANRLAATPAATTPGVSGSPTTQASAPTAQPKSMMDRLKTFGYEPSATAATATPARATPFTTSPATPGQTKADAIQRMQPNTPNAIDTAPPGSLVTPGPMQPVETKEQNTMNMQQVPPEKPQQQITIDPFLNRSDNKMPTQSLARAMQNTIDPNGAIGNRFGTNIGGMG